jgi:hypothetical protein
MMHNACKYDESD